MSVIPKQRWTAAEYLAFERRSEEKHEFFDGDVYLMSGASREHNLIVFNIGGLLRDQLKGRPWEGYINDLRVKIENDNYVYPDVVVVCDEPQFEDAEVDTLLNPTLIIEVLSPSTEATDRGRKFLAYRALSSLQEYLLIAQDNYRVEHYVRQINDQWLFSATTSMDALVKLPSINCTLQLAEVYDKVVFEAK